MPTNETIESALTVSENSSKIFWWCFAFLLVAVFIFHGKPVPYSNEFLYLLRLAPNFLPNDWTFSQPANEHWFFNFLFSFPARIFSLEVVGWLGRIAVWISCLAALIRLGRRWTIPVWAIAVSIFLWLAFGQSVVGEEWVVGGFEAKTAAYICLLFALDLFCERKIIVPSILLGLSFSFHPAVGLWAIAAIGLIIFFEKNEDEKKKPSYLSFILHPSSFLKVVGLTGVFSLFGLVPLFAEQANSAAAYSFDDWQFVVLYRVPWHLDLFQFSRSGMILIFVMLIFNCAVLWKSESFALRFLLKFQVALGAFFLFGYLLRWLELYPLLRLMPMRLFPIFTPLFFLFTAFYFIPQIENQTRKLIVLLAVILIIASLNPFGKGFNQIRQTVQSWTTAPDDLQKTSVWISKNTPPDATIIQPPNSREFWYWSHRASVASFAYPTYDRLGEWRERVANLTGNLKITKGDAANEEIEAAFNNLSQEQIEQLKNKYAASYLVSRAVYSYPVIYKTETYKVYQLR
ncbi:MAG: DUF6798 domain-containing protein [Pyrinomonadaceae bacterium]